MDDYPALFTAPERLTVTDVVTSVWFLAAAIVALIALLALARVML